MGWRDRIWAIMAGQLGRPEGLLGRLVGRRLNRGNRASIAAAVAATDAGPGQTVADIGFGGGVGLAMLLDRVGSTGHVHGIDLSQTMVDSARRKYSAQVEAGSLTLQAGSITDLPLADASVDAVMTVNTIYFVADLTLAFAELTRVLRPGGYVVVGLGDPVMMSRMPFTQHGFIIRPVDGVVTTLVDAGLNAVKRLRVGPGDDAYHLLVAGRAR